MWGFLLKAELVMGQLADYGAFPIPGYKDQDYMKPAYFLIYQLKFSGNFVYYTDLYCPAVISQICKLNFRY